VELIVTINQYNMIPGQVERYLFRRKHKAWFAFCENVQDAGERIYGIDDKIGSAQLQARYDQSINERTFVETNADSVALPDSVLLEKGSHPIAE
jgi:hypothetical protein